MRRLGPVDLLAYVRALGLYVRNPSLVVAPLATSLAGSLLGLLVPSNGPGDPLSGGLMQLFVMLLDSFGLAVSLIVAEAAWRVGRAPFDDAWTTARRKAPDILLAAVGFTFLINVAGLVGGFLGALGGLVLSAVAGYFFIYTIPAAAIGGVPGFAALQASIDRVQRSYVGTLVLALVIVLLVLLYMRIWAPISVLLLNGPAFLTSTAFIVVLQALLKSIGLGYIALVMAKAFEDAAYYRR